MKLNLVGPFIVNSPFGTEIAFAKGLRRIGHEVIEVDPNIDREMAGLHNTADATVVFKSCVGSEKYLRSLTHPIVVYQPDDARFPHIREMMLMMRQYADLFMSFDDHSIVVAKTMGYRAVETLLLTADDELYCPSPEPIERDIDVSFIGSLGDPVAHARRRHMLDVVSAEVEGRGWKCHFEQTQDIPKIVDVYRRSKVVLNHATDVGQPFGWGYGIQCRHFEVGMTRTLLLSNKVYDWPGDTRKCPPFWTFHDERTLIDQLEFFISNEKSRDDLTSYAYDQIMINHCPQHRAHQMIDFIVRNS